jgi:hypothetical protein
VTTPYDTGGMPVPAEPPADAPVVPISAEVKLDLLDRAADLMIDFFAAFDNGDDETVEETATAMLLHPTFVVGFLSRLENRARMRRAAGERL